MSATKKLNQSTQSGAARAADHQDPLERAYLRCLRAAGRRAATRFRQGETLNAAANPEQPPNWTIPPTLSLIDQQELAADTVQKTAALHRAILAAAAGEALSPFGISFDITAPVSQAILDVFAARIQATITSAIAEQVTQAIQTGYQTGQSVAQVATAITKATDEISPVRAQMLARSDLNGIANAASHFAAQTTGAAKFKVWTTAGDDRVRPDHEDADGQTVAINDTFDIGGEQAMYPGDPSLSWEESANCRCVITYTNDPSGVTASSGARPSDFASWRDWAWEGSGVAAAGGAEGASGKTAGARNGIAGQEVGLAAAATPGVLYLIRHGETAYDSDEQTSDQIRGWLDDPLDDRGQQEAQRIAQQLVGTGITSLDCSDLLRTRETAAIIANHLGLNAKASDAWRPWNMGDFQGQKSSAVADQLAEYVDHPDDPVPGGESFTDFASRFLPVLAGLAARAEAGETVAVVTHSQNAKIAKAWLTSGRQPVTGTQFSVPAPAPGTVTYCAPTDGSWLVVELPKPGSTEAGAVPGWANYRPAENPARACETCAYYEQGLCVMFDADVIADYVCDEWADTRTSETPEAAVTSGGTMSGILLNTDGSGGGGIDLFAATGDTGLPLSERDRAWDAGAAGARVKKWASSDGSGDPDKIDYKKLARAFFWQDEPGDGGPKIGDFKLPFADIIGGKLTAVWRGVTAAAGRLGQTQGVDEGAVQSKIASYYNAAKKKYSDDSIQVPWVSGSHSANGELLAELRVFLADHGADVLSDDELRAHVLAQQWLARQQLGGMASTSKHRYAGNGGACEICGEPPDDPDAHYAAITASLRDFVLTAAADGPTKWTATLCVADEPTVDSGIKRVLMAGGGSWLPLPLPLGFMDETPHADVVTKSPVCGRIDQIWQAGNVYQASGIFLDYGTDAKTMEIAQRAATVVENRAIDGVSVDLCDTEVELAMWGAGGRMDAANDPTADETPQTAPGGPATEANLPRDIPEADVIEALDDDGEEVFLFTQWVIAGATIVPVAALAPAATITVLAASPDGWTTWQTPRDAFYRQTAPVTAAAAGLAPLEPPSEWFTDPEFDGPTPLTVTDDGRVFGHLANWDTCHTGRPGCVTPPHSRTGYANFHRGALKTAEGDEIAVGLLTMNVGHAGLRMTPDKVVAHYDDTSTQAAHVRAGEDDFGIWVAGAINPDLSEEDARKMRAATISGDWREISRGEGLDLFAALIVNGPGFVVPRVGARMVASGVEMEPVALVAAGALEACEECAEGEDGFSWRPWRRDRVPA